MVSRSTGHGRPREPADKGGLTPHLAAEACGGTPAWCSHPPSWDSTPRTRTAAHTSWGTHRTRGPAAGCPAVLDMLSRSHGSHGPGRRPQIYPREPRGSPNVVRVTLTRPLLLVASTHVLVFPFFSYFLKPVGSKPHGRQLMRTHCCPRMAELRRDPPPGHRPAHTCVPRLAHEGCLHVPRGLCVCPARTSSCKECSGSSHVSPSDSGGSSPRPPTCSSDPGPARERPPGPPCPPLSLAGALLLPWWEASARSCHLSPAWGGGPAQMEPPRGKEPPGVGPTHFWAPSLRFRTRPEGQTSRP